MYPYYHIPITISSKQYHESRIQNSRTKLSPPPHQPRTFDLEVDPGRVSGAGRTPGGAAVPALGLLAHGVPPHALVVHPHAQSSCKTTNEESEYSERRIMR